MSEQKQYGHYDDSIMDDDWYAIHVNAMTAEQLHSKAEIAAELAYRDRRIAALNDRNAMLVKERDAYAETENDQRAKLAALEEVAEAAAEWFGPSLQDARFETVAIIKALHEAGYTGTTQESGQ